MALVSVKHWEGMGDHYLIRVAGYRPGDPDAVEVAAEHLAEEIGTARGGDGYGYALDYGDGDGWTDLGVHWVDEGQYVITQDWRPIRPTAPMTYDGGFVYGGERYTKVVDANGRRWTYSPARDYPGYWTCEESDSDPEHWTLELADPTDIYDNALIRKCRERDNWTPEVI